MKNLVRGKRSKVQTAYKGTEFGVKVNPKLTRHALIRVVCASRLVFHARAKVIVSR